MPPTFQKRHINRTLTQMANYKACRRNPQMERVALLAWLGSIKELLDTETLKEILIYIYQKNFPNEQAVNILTGQEE